MNMPLALTLIMCFNILSACVVAFLLGDATTGQRWAMAFWCVLCAVIGAFIYGATTRSENTPGRR